MSTHYPNLTSRSGGFGSVFKSLTKSLKPSSKAVAVTINPTVVGGGDELQKLILHLKTGSVASRAQTADRVAESIDKYSISSIPEIWYLGRDLCDIQHPSYVRQSGINLMIKCISHGDSAVGNRLLYFKDILQYCQLSLKLDPEYDQFLQALIQLTANGEDVHDFCIYDEDKNLNNFISLSLSILVAEFHELDAKFTKNLLTTLTFVGNCLKYNYNSLDDELISTILTDLIILSQKTMNIDIAAAILAIISTTIVMGDIPPQNYLDCIKYFCWVYGLHLSPNLNELIWNSIQALCADAHSYLLIEALCQTIQDPDLVRFRNMTINSLGLQTIPINANIGAIQLVLKIQIVNSLQNFNVDCFQISILHSITNTLALNIPFINTSYLRSFDHLLNKGAYVENFGIDSKEVFAKVLPFHLWYSSFSLFDVFKNFKANNNQDLDYLQSICNGMQGLYEDHELDAPKEKLAQYFLHNHTMLTPDNILFVLRYYSQEKLCTILNPLWQDNSVLILNYFYYQSNNVQVKLECLRVIIEAFTVSTAISVSQNIDYDLILDILRKSRNEQDPLLVDYLMDNIFTFVAIQCPPKTFQHFCRSFISDLQLADDPASLKLSQTLGSFRSFGGATTLNSSLIEAKPDQFSPVYLDKFAKAVARIFALTLTKEAAKAKQSYEIMVLLVEHALSKKNVDILLTLSKCLVRLRATTENHIYLSDPSDMTGLAGAFKRNTSDSGYVPQESYKWVYPESLPYLPEKYFNIPSKRLSLYTLTDNPGNEDDDNQQTIDISKWFKFVITIMEHFIDWEVYSFIWAHFCSQLTNMQLFQYDQDHIIKLKAIVCDQLTTNLPSSVKLPEEIAKADLQVALIRSMSALLGYHHHFSKYDEDQLIKALIFGLDWWEKTAIPCINILTICCYEIPISMLKFVPVILTKLQTRVTSAFASTHTLEFLMSLVEVPSLITNFSIDDFKRVFGIAFKYIQFAHDMKTRKQNSLDKPEAIILQQYGVDAEVDQSTSTLINDFTPLLSQYVFTLSYRVIASWYLKINLNDRKKITSYLIKNLVLCSQIENKLDDHTIGFLDFIFRFTYSDLPLQFLAKNSSKDDEFKTSRWIMGKMILSMETNYSDGDSKWSIIRPTGATHLLVKLDEDIIAKKDEQILQSNFYLLQLFENITNSKSKPIPIIDDPITGRAMLVLSRIPTLEFHKIGIIYIGPNQSNELEVLGNRSGSTNYQNFINHIGELYKLKQSPSKIYVGGLDVENNDDGEYTRYWSDKIIQVVFHIVTMMSSTNMNNKKRHIGNNYINIYFDESGQDFNFNLIKSQFNFISIVISPHSFSSDDKIIKYHGITNKFFKVKTFRRSGIPGVFSTSHFKLISGENLPQFVRNLAIITDHFAQIWHSTQYVSNWSQRVKQINTIIEKTKQNYENLHQINEEEASHKETTQSFLQQLQENLNDDGIDQVIDYGQVTIDEDDEKYITNQF